MMHAVLHGVTRCVPVTAAFEMLAYKRRRDQLMGRHKANHVNVVYAPSAEQAVKVGCQCGIRLGFGCNLNVRLQALYVKAAMLQEMGVHVHLCGNLE